jgi:hypothetical protein
MTGIPRDVPPPAATPPLPDPGKPIPSTPPEVPDTTPDVPPTPVPPSMSWPELEEAAEVEER